MSTQQKKTERQRRKRQKKQRQQRVRSVRAHEHQRSDANPVYACLANTDWQESGKAAIFFARRTGTGVSAANFLVDTWAMGLKDVWGETGISAPDFEQMIDRYAEHVLLEPLPVGTARHLVYGGIQLANELGFRLPKRYERWTKLLGPLPQGESPDMDLFLYDGKILLCCSETDFRARLIGTTPEQFLARPDVAFIFGGDGFSLSDEQEDECPDILSLVEQNMVEEIRQWCFANGQAPHPLLPDVIGATLEAMVQSLPPDFDPECDQIEAPSGFDNAAAARTDDFLSGSLGHDRRALDDAIAQLRAFLRANPNGPDTERILRP